jgi:hypothetical protein
MGVAAFGKVSAYNLIRQPRTRSHSPFAAFSLDFACFVDRLNQSSCQMNRSTAFFACALLAIIASCLFHIPALARDADEPAVGVLEGLVIFRGEIPKSATPDDAGIRRDLLEVDVETRGLRNVVAYLTPASDSKAPLFSVDAGKKSGQKPLVDQENNEFTPRIIAVEQGQTVVFGNSDPANHNVRTTASMTKNQFNIFTGIDG